jgi:DNA-binding response OmpR family regulator
MEDNRPNLTIRGQSTSGLVFIVEDDRDVASLVSHVLTRGGFQTRTFHAARGVSEAAIEQLPILILLDGMLPDQDGTELLRLLEQHKSTQGIRKIMLSARAAESDKVRALELGADDYITKPFSTRELIARINAVLRNSGEGEDPHRTLCVGPLFVDLDAREVSVDSRAIALTATEFNLVVYFMQHPGQVISRDKLMADLWRNDRTVEDRVVDVYIRRLRTKIEPDPARPSRLVTIRGDGYLLVDPCGRGLRSQKYHSHSSPIRDGLQEPRGTK